MSSWLETLCARAGVVSEGDVCKTMIAVDWTATSLGDPDGWPQSLRSVIEMMLATRYPIFIAWGDDLTFLYNDAYAPFLGERHPAAMGTRTADVWHEVWPDLEPLVRLALSGQATWSEDIHLVMTRNGYEEDTWWTFSYSPLYDEAGAVAGIIDICSDSTQKVLNERRLQAESERLRASEEQLRLVVNELNHRVKNSLAMVQAIAMQTFRKTDDLEQAAERFSARLVALARANDLLTGDRWTGVDLRGVLVEAVASHQGEAERLVLDGPDIDISPKSALALTLAAHELATNAVKYGAWSAAGGTVTIRWSATPEGAETRLFVEWKETGGPSVAPPTRRGFGSRLIERGLASELNGEVALAFESDGVACRIEALVGAED